MNSPSPAADGVRVGSQVPRVRKVPDYERSLGLEVVDFMAEIGRPLDQWQASIVVDTFGLRPDGFWSAFEVVGLVPRQNGKGGFTEAIELGGLFLFRDQLVMHSAHLFKTAKNSFQRLVDIIDNSDWLRQRVQKVVRARGDEEIKLTPTAGGGSLLCFSRSAGSGRGFTGDKTVFDESAYLTIEQYAAATPTLATVPNPQIIYTGTPPDEDVGPMPDDAMMPSVRKRGHAGEDRIALYEWSPPKKADATDRDVWYDCNPALGIRITEWFLAKQLANFTAAGKPAKFATEHLGAWPDDEDNQWRVISEDDWTNYAQDPDSSAVGRVAFSLDVNPERTAAALGVAGQRADGDLHAEVVDHRPGKPTWAVGRLVEVCRKWRPAAVVVDPAGAAGALIPDIEEALKPLGIELTKLTGRQVAAAYGKFRDGVSSAPDTESPDYEPAIEAEANETEAEAVEVRRVRVRPHPALTLAVAGAGKRRVGDGTSWDRRSPTVDICPLVAVTNAVFGFITAPEPEPASTAPLVAWR